jgi:hypothetical protein
MVDAHPERARGAYDAHLARQKAFLDPVTDIVVHSGVVGVRAHPDPAQ